MSRVHSSFLSDQLRVADSLINHEMVMTVSPGCKSCKVKNHYMRRGDKSDGTVLRGECTYRELDKSRY